MYQSEWKGNIPLIYQTDNLDDIMAAHNCQNAVIMEDLNQHLVMGAFTEFTAVQGLLNCIDFPTYQCGGSRPITD